MVTAIFRVIRKTQHDQKQDGNSQYNIEMCPVMSEPFGKYTPCGKIEMTIFNDSAAEKFEVGKEYSVNFQPIEAH